MRATWFRRMVLTGALTALLVGSIGTAHAYEFTRTLKKGLEGKDVKAFQVRIAGWFPHSNQTHLALDGRFGPTTAEAVRAFETFRGLAVDGVAGPEVFKVIDQLEDDDGSTLHFAWSEFQQHSSGGCSAAANASAGSFQGGLASPLRVKLNVKRVMWRLEAIRAKAGAHPVGVNSGFRSVAYNDCINGASLSQHMFGTAADTVVSDVGSRKARNIAKGSQLHGIGCYSDLRHNHFDIRIDNDDLASQRAWWWPDRDSAGRDLDERGRPCWGEKGHKRAANEIMSAAEVAAWAALGEAADLAGLD